MPAASRQLSSSCSLPWPYQHSVPVKIPRLVCHCPRHCHLLWRHWRLSYNVRHANRANHGLAAQPWALLQDWVCLTRSLALAERGSAQRLAQRKAFHYDLKESLSDDNFFYTKIYSFPTIDFYPPNKDGRIRENRLSKLHFLFWRYASLTKIV